MKNLFCRIKQADNIHLDNTDEEDDDDDNLTADDDVWTYRIIVVPIENSLMMMSP